MNRFNHNAIAIKVSQEIKRLYQLNAASGFHEFVYSTARYMEEMTEEIHRIIKSEGYRVIKCRDEHDNNTRFEIKVNDEDIAMLSTINSIKRMYSKFKKHRHIKRI